MQVTPEELQVECERLMMLSAAFAGFNVHVGVDAKRLMTTLTRNGLSHGVVIPRDVLLSRLPRYLDDAREKVEVEERQPR